MSPRLDLLFLASMVLVGAQFASTFFFLRRLRVQHPKVFAELGSPFFGGPPPAKNTSEFFAQAFDGAEAERHSKWISYLVAGEWRTLDDASLHRLGHATRLCLVLSFFAGIPLFVLGLYEIVR